MWKFLFTVMLITSIILTGCNVNSPNNSYNEETKEKAIEAVEKYLQNNFVGITSVQVTDIYQSPMSGLTVDGNVNDGEADFSAGVESDYTIGSIGVSKEFPERKEECKENTCGD
ncbi:DUF1433 domain-containing protein [Sediminibacillus halophilus]|uniref:DUF1433 domain-containing protein n=1 Tax=Sediminibacillus halophilus TaxID=482461 RepID=A0A1G9V6M1_9BACI|nr:DUF1433 domain-containing protein [Sediminibacillus halophilus]SDM67555.1 Protein of unknown function [Sediminibacillus halophilus]